MADTCIYCFSEDNITNEHIFPQCIGGKIDIHCCCRGCNSVIGCQIEGGIKDSLFFAEGIAKLGIESRAEAYRNIDIRDAVTGEKLRYVGDDLQLRPYIRSDSTIIGPSKDVREIAMGRVKKRFPNWLEYFRKKLENAPDSSISLPGEKHTFKHEESVSPIVMKSKAIFPFKLLAKICYEALRAFGMFSTRSLNDFCCSTFQTYKRGDQTTRIEVLNGFYRRVNTLYQHMLKAGFNYSGLNYQPFHRIDFRLSRNGVAYVKMNFFEVISFLVAVAEMKHSEVRDPDLLAKRLIFPIDESRIYPRDLTGRKSELRATEDVVAELSWQAYCGKSRDD